MSPSAPPTSQTAPAHLVPANLLGDGEIVVLAIKPSNWFVLIVSLPALASMALAAGVAFVVHRYRPGAPEEVIYFFAAAIAMARLVGACWQWLGRTYVLTNRRAVCVRGLVKPSVESVDLADLGEAVLAPSLFERPLGVGSILCVAGESDSDRSISDRTALIWNTVADPGEISDIVNEAIEHARRANG